MMLMGMYLDEQILNTISDSLSVKSLKFDIDTSPEKIKVNIFPIRSTLVDFDGDMDLKLTKSLEPMDVIASLKVIKKYKKMCV